MSIKALVCVLPLLTAGVSAAVAANNCAKNQCYAQVSANRFAPPAFRSSGCFSFMASTVTPAAVTVTKTVAAGFDAVTPGPACATTAAAASVVPAYASSCAGNAQYMSACQCFGIMKSTTTLKRCTTTVLRTTGTTAAGTTAAGTTTFATAAAPTGCSNQGLAFAVYDNAAIDQQTGYYNFDPAALTNPLYTGSISQIQNFYVPNEQDQVAIYGQYVHGSNGFALNHVGYLFAPQSGTYTFTASNVDDVFNFWIGERAFNGFSRENDNLDTFFFFSTGPTLEGTYTGIPGAASYSVQLVGGLYYPFRYIFGQSTGPATFSFAITAPDGTQLFGSNQPNSAYLVRYSCDGVLAPPFPQFGAAVAPSTTLAGTSAVVAATSAAAVTSAVAATSAVVTPIVTL